MKKEGKKGVSALLLHDIRSAENVGSLFRTAEAAGLSRVYLSGYTPLPVDRFGRKDKRIAKSALGAEEMLPSEGASAEVLIERLKKEGYFIVGIEQGEGAVDYRALSLHFPVLFILGNEVEGISPELQKKCDVLAEIPLVGKKESLNVSVAAGVFLFRTLHG